MTTNLIEVFPDVLIFAVFQFLNVNSMTNLDSAFCNQDLRPTLMGLFVNDDFVLFEDEDDDGDIHEEASVWLCGRQISFGQLKLCGSQFLRVAPELLELLWDDRRLVKLTILQDSEENAIARKNVEGHDQLVAALINKHRRFTSIEIESDGFEASKIFKLVEEALVSRLTSLKLNRNAHKPNNLIKLLSDLCSTLRVLEVGCSIHLPSQLQTLLVKNDQLTELSLQWCKFSSTLVNCLCNLEVLKYVRLGMFYDHSGDVQDCVEELGNACKKWVYFELNGSNFFHGDRLRFCVDKQDEQHHKMYIGDWVNPSTLWLLWFSSKSVKTLTLSSDVRNLSTAFLDDISVRLSALEVLTFDDMLEFSSGLPKLVSKCVCLTTIIIKDCQAAISVDNLLEIFCANKNIVNFTIEQETLTVAGFKKLLEGCRCLQKLQSVACFSEELSIHFERNDELLNKHFKSLNLQLSFYKSEEEEEEEVEEI
jgi:hypothetical protein